jgi:hypothetical protein
MWNGTRAVIKACSPTTNSLGVTSTMLPRLEFILAAIETNAGLVELWALPQPEFCAAMYDSQSKSAVGGKVKLARRSLAIEKGSHIGAYSRAAIDAAAKDVDSP